MTATEAPEEVGEQGSPSRKKAGESTTNAKHTRKTACPVPLSVTENFPLRFDVNDFRFERSKLLGEGHIGKVMIANYRGLPIACKCRRSQKPRRVFHDHIARELTFAAKLSVCRFMNPYLGVFECSPQHLKFSSSVDASGPAITATSRGSYKDLYIVQRYYEHGDLRDLMEKRATKHFHPIEVLQIAISLSAALTDAHKLGIGIVDLKLENILMDANGSGWITDFGSCVEMNGQDELNLIEMQIPWTNDVAAPEMIQHGVFRKESDIFMAMLIVAEVMTPNLSDKEFQEHVLSRHKDGSVNFRTAAINPIYSPFYGVLQRSLHSDPKQRPDALSMLFYFEAMRKESLTNLTAQIPMSFRDTKQDDISTYGDDTTDFILSSADSASDLSDVNHE
ncbi:hypothetical protein DFQ28_001717 [Apophysomyces sp. BC1034]|nr:hypothetical protein DFQ30_008166 [Apophysomyces sp. BC1015]KAG0180121.1 hypothetical protein DFQ29_001223 [Apophysomyces sp. BC1021]KAG0190689.1 hypothetical protein DFQ28_001717 [Apophysomyces sp. BC1034]